MKLAIQVGKYQHYKGGEYQVIDLVQHSETDETLVLYRPLYGDQKLWVRPFQMFVEQVKHDGQSVPRFRYLGPMEMIP